MLIEFILYSYQPFLITVQQNIIAFCWKIE